MFLLFLFELIVGEAYLQNYCKFLFLIDIIDAMKTIYFPIILVAASVETYSIELHVMSDLKLQWMWLFAKSLRFRVRSKSSGSSQNYQVARGFAREFLRSGQLYRPGQKLKILGKSCSLHSKKQFVVGGCGFFVSDVIVEDFWAALAHFTWPWAQNVRW